MKRTLAALASGLLLAGLAAPAYAQGTTAQAPASSPACQFVLGFKTLHDQDSGDVGNCVDNQASAANGDAVQHTSNGLMVWRKADNWTAFTNGYTTWIDGPDGLQSRLNTDRFPWENAGQASSTSAPATTPAPAATPTDDSLPGVATGPLVTTPGPDDSQPLGNAPAGGFVPIQLPAGCSAYVTEQPRFDANDKSSAQPQGRTWLQIDGHLTCNGQATPISSLPQATLDAACSDALAKYQVASTQGGMVLTAKDYLCPKLSDPFYLN